MLVYDDVRLGFDKSCFFLLVNNCTTIPITIDMSVNPVAKFLQYELCCIKAVLDRFRAKQFVYARTLLDLFVPLYLWLVPQTAPR